MPPRARKAVTQPTTAIEGEVVEKTDTPIEEWSAAELGGRRIAFRRPSPAQLIVLRRLNRQLDTTKDFGQKFMITAKFMDAVSALMISDADREWADMEVLEGRVDLPEITPLIVAAIGGPEAHAAWKAQEADPTPPPRRVRRARS